MWRSTVVIRMKDGGNLTPIIKDYGTFSSAQQWVSRLMSVMEDSNMGVLEVSHRFQGNPEGGENEEIIAPF